MNRCITCKYFDGPRLEYERSAMRFAQVVGTCLRYPGSLRVTPSHECGEYDLAVNGIEREENYRRVELRAGIDAKDAAGAGADYWEAWAQRMGVLL